ncbi:MAG: cyclic nucleotide-binding protein [Crocinitomicaceae bacterium]|nr:cyclic nucleotide-binding protein [Crocinitomicaceae bacterium]|tara:strand:+ start:12927 stop:13484 length:558 start_codon:yes stop_codon:yes gene_type:complete
MNTSLESILPEEYLQALLSIGKEKSIKANAFFVRAGDHPTKIAFVYSGLFRYVYTNNKGDEFTKSLIPENNFISSYSAMIQNRPSSFAIEALEDARILEVSWERFQPFLAQDAFWLKFLLQFIEKGFIAKEKRERDLLLLDAETRYRNFLQEFPGIDQRVKQGVIASYLGIQPETLSRIRRKIVF